MTMLVLGAVLIGVAAVLDSFFRIRMQRIGDKWALLYSLYHKASQGAGLGSVAGLRYVGRCGWRW